MKYEINIKAKGKPVKQLFESIKNEIGAIKSKRSTTKVKLLKEGLIVKIIAQDATSAWASTNNMLRAATIFEKTMRIK